MDDGVLVIGLVVESVEELLVVKDAVVDGVLVIMGGMVVAERWGFLFLAMRRRRFLRLVDVVSG